MFTWAVIEISSSKRKLVETIGADLRSHSHAPHPGRFLYEMPVYGHLALAGALPGVPLFEPFVSILRSSVV